MQLHSLPDATTIPFIRRIVAPNPSPMTEAGTNSYLVGHDDVVVIDPGPDHPGHLAALLAAIGPRRVTGIVITHSHLDHSGLAPALSRATGAEVVAFGGSLAGQSAVMRRLAQAGLAGGGEGVDIRFTPDRIVADGDRIDSDGGALRVIHTPGHMGNHICLAFGHVIFSGDHVMDWSTSLISPPEGDLTDYMRSLHRLREEDSTRLLPGHGAAVTSPAARIAWLIAHRQEREEQVLAALESGPASLAEVTARVYADIPAALHPAAARNAFAHLVDLSGRTMVRADPDLGPDARFTRA